MEAVLKRILFGTAFIFLLKFMIDFWSNRNRWKDLGEVWGLKGLKVEKFEGGFRAIKRIFQTLEITFIYLRGGSAPEN